MATHPISFVENSSPDWRWKLAHYLAESRVRCRSTDTMVRRLVAFLRAGERGAKVDAELANVVALQRDSGVVESLKILLLSGTAVAEVAKRLALAPEQVQLWHDLFFEVTQRLDAPGWIHHWVISSERGAGQRKLAKMLKLAASGGPRIADMLLKQREGVALPPDERILLQQLQLEIKLSEALDVPLTSSAQAVRIIEVQAKLRKSELEYQLEKDRMAADERQAEREHEQRLLQLRSEYASLTLQAHILELQFDPLSFDLQQDYSQDRSVITVFPGRRAAASAGESNDVDCNAGTNTDSGESPVIFQISAGEMLAVTLDSIAPSKRRQKSA